VISKNLEAGGARAISDLKSAVILASWLLGESRLCLALEN
jgi:hypothetical protein